VFQSAGLHGLVTVARIADACGSGWVNPGVLPRGLGQTSPVGRTPGPWPGVNEHSSGAVSGSTALRLAAVSPGPWARG
jgi:hypothetical protein